MNYQLNKFKILIKIEKLNECSIINMNFIKVEWW